MRGPISMRGLRKGIRFRRMHFKCGRSGVVVGSFSTSIGRNRGVTVINPAKTKGAAVVGLLVHFCSIGKNSVGVSKRSIQSFGEDRLHRVFKVILRSA